MYIYVRVCKGQFADGRQTCNKGRKMKIKVEGRSGALGGVAEYLVGSGGRIGASFGVGEN